MNATITIPIASGELVGLVLNPEHTKADAFKSLECGCYNKFLISETNVADIVADDTGRRISCLLLDSHLGEQALKKLLARRHDSVRHHYPPQAVLLHPEDKELEPVLLKAGADRVISIDSSPFAQQLIIESLIKEYRSLISLTTELGWRKSAVGQIEQGVFRFFTRREARNLATMLSLTCPDPVPVAVGLTELLVNAVEHGCLGLKPGEKEALIKEGMLNNELARRRADPSNDDKSVVVVFESSLRFRKFCICDPGEGFDYKDVFRPEEVDCSMAKSGRGILMANACFSTMQYQGKGNVVVATVEI